MEDRAGKLIMERLAALKQTRGVWESLWKRSAEVVWPDADEFHEERRTPGQRRDYRRFDATAMSSVEKFAAVMESLLTPRQRQWHTLRATNEELHDDPDVKRWFEQSTKLLFAARSAPRASFYSEVHRAYKSLGSFGNLCIFVEERPTGGMRYECCHLGNVYIDVDKDGRVNTIMREYRMTAGAAVEKWRNAVPEAISKAAEKSPTQEFKFIHAVIPNGERNPQALDYRRMPWSAFDVADERQTVMRRGGYEEMPYLFSRYTLASNEMYGRGPTQVYLPEIFMLDQMARTFIRAGHKAVDPPLLVHDDGIIGRGSKRISLDPGRFNWGGVDSNGRQMIQPFVSGVNVPEFQFMMENTKTDVRGAFLVPLYEALLENPNMTATQVLELTRQNGILLAPMIGRQHSELLGPLIERELAILGRQGILPPLPDALADAEYEVVYESPGTRQQRTEDALALQRMIESMTAFIQTDPQALDIFKPDVIGRGLGGILGVPSEWIRSEQEMEELAERRAAEAQRQQQMLEAQQMAATGKDAAQAISAVQAA